MIDRDDLDIESLNLLGGKAGSDSLRNLVEVPTVRNGRDLLDREIINLIDMQLVVVVVIDVMNLMESQRINLRRRQITQPDNLDRAALSDDDAD